MAKLPWLVINGELRQALAAIQDGNEGSQNWEVLRGHLLIFSYRALSPGRAAFADRDDLVQWVLLRLQNPATFARVCNAVAPGQYLAKMLLNRVRKEYHDASLLGRSLRRLTKEAATRQADSPAWTAQQKDLFERVMRVAAEVLSEEDCLALKAFHLDGLSAGDIATKLDCTQQAVWQRLSRARKQIREAWSKE